MFTAISSAKKSDQCKLMIYMWTDDFYLMIAAGDTSSLCINASGKLIRVHNIYFREFITVAKER